MLAVPLLVFFLVGFFFLLVILHARRTVGYLYCNAVVSTWEAKLLPEARLLELAEVQRFEELRSSLGEAGYPLPESMDPVELERSLLEVSSGRLAELLGMVPEERRETVRRILARMEVWNLKAILTSLHLKESKEERRKRLLSCPTLPKERLEFLASAETLEQLLEFLKESEYYGVLSSALEEYGREGLSPLLFALDRHYYSRLWEEVVGKKAQRSVLVPLVGFEIDSLNLRLILRLKREGVPPERIDALVIRLRPPYQLGEELLKALISAEDLRTCVELLSHTPYGRILSPLLPQLEAGDLFPLERALEEEHLRLCRWASLTKPFTLAPIYSYVRRKEVEVRNLHLLLRLKLEGAPPERIKELLVRVPGLEA